MHAAAPCWQSFRIRSAAIFRRHLSSTQIQSNWNSSPLSTPGWTMSHWKDDPSPQTDSIIIGLQDLVDKCRAPMRREAGEKKEELTENDLETKNALLVRLESTLLPSLRNQLSSYLTALSIQDSPGTFQPPNPNTKFIIEISSKLAKTFDETKKSVEFAALDIIPMDTHDHHLKQFKNFRCARLMSSFAEARHSFHTLFDHSIAFARASQAERNHIENTDCHRRMLIWKSVLTERVDSCNKRIAGLFIILEGTDFEIIQDDWQRCEECLDAQIVFLTKILHFPTWHQMTDTAVEKQVIELAKSTLPIVKLARMFCREFSKSSRQKLPFKLDTELNSETLFQFHRTAEEVTVSFGALIRAFEDSFNSSSLAEHETLIRNQIQKISQTLDSTLLLLTTYLIPLPSGTNSFSLENHYKARFAAWQDVWHRAINNFLTTFQCFVNEHQHQHPAPGHQENT
ncbi:hypothetical protein PSTG_12487 [Puccinia striiformis f. sp. tritici PST-78]|uniref:Uncharacterized protein n=1 Tax=Puccinia striiformis f. sp. tritici PST-78 TaxID=1165861 RepID=A0A0L0V4P0_9BASI|nr:hypothetical protein PSTG_12487 [Puccinia striiformis f. sp. tritici PST-78]